MHRLPWDVPRRTLVVLLLVAGAYALAAIGVAFAEWRGRRVTFGLAVVAAGAALLPAPLAYGMLQPPLEFNLLLVGIGAAFLLAVVAFLLRGHRVLTLAMQGALVVAAGVAQAANFSAVKNDSGVVSELIDTTLYDLDAVYFRAIPKSRQSQGGITRFGDRYLLVVGNGDLYVFSRSGREELDIRRLAYTTPINIADFEAAAGTQVPIARFRAADAVSQVTPAGLRLFVTHHYWNARDACWVMRVSSLEGSIDDFLSPSAPLAWSTVYETSPCVGLSVTEVDPVRFTGIENGGRMAWLEVNRLLVTFGDHEMDGWATTVMAAQDPASSYGKIVLIDVANNTHEMFSLGHRNPQGLYVSAGTIWSTEHGPDGGDELNRITQGTNYGWPLATYGVEYGTNSWPLTANPGRHEGFQRPFFSWTPSIGISSLIEVTNSRFEHWRGDLLVGSLVNQSLWRIRIRDDRVVMTEHIPIGQRIRDIEQGHDGELVMWTNDHTIAFVTPGEGTASGEFLYRVCAGCHVPLEGSTTAVGPSLVGLMGRDVASAQGFTDYSPGLQALGGKWTRDRLNAFIRDPRAMVPGTTMHFAGIEDDANRELLLDYLENPDSRLDVSPLAPL